MSRCCANGALEQHTLTQPIDDKFVLFLEDDETDGAPILVPEEEECFFLECFEGPAEFFMIKDTSGEHIPADAYAAIAAVHNARVGHNGYKRTEKRLRGIKGTCNEEEVSRKGRRLLSIHGGQRAFHQRTTHRQRLATCSLHYECHDYLEPSKSAKKRSTTRD